MNLKELDSFKISDAITFHDKLNPKLWNGTKLRPEVKQQLEAIADDFLQEMGIHELDVRDITISGSNAAYSYTDHSDLDLHILVNVNDLPSSDVYKELFQAKKTIYNDTHNITIHKVPVELYVQDASEPVVSLGEYSIKNDSWIKIPTKRRSNFDQNATKAKHNKLLDIVERAIESNNLNKIQKVLKKIKQYRQAGLDNGGEFGPENLAYKALRSQGYITKLYDLRDKLHSEYLTIENMYQPIKDDVNEAFNQPYPIKWEKGDHGDLDALAKLPDGSPLSIMFNKEQDDDGDEITQVQFYRNNSQEVTGEGDAQRIFATVLTAIQQYIKKRKPLRLTFAASKETDPTIYYEPGQPQPNPESRAKLYDRLVQRYSKAWGYRAFRADNGDLVMYELSRINKTVTEVGTGTMQYAAEKTPPTNPYGGLRDYQYRGSMSEARRNPERNLRAGSGKYDLINYAEDIRDKDNWAVSMTMEPKLGINPQAAVSEDTPKGIYFYPLRYFMQMADRDESLPWGDNFPYLQLFQYDRSGEMTQQTKVDPAKLKQALSQYCSDEIMQQAAEEDEYDGTPYWYIYDCLSRLGKGDETNVIRWNKVLRDLGFTSVYDPGRGWIAHNEPTQGVILDPRVIKAHKMFDNRNPTMQHYRYDIHRLADTIGWSSYYQREKQLQRVPYNHPDEEKVRLDVAKTMLKPFLGKSSEEAKEMGYDQALKAAADKVIEILKKPINEASGYIPSEKEKNDPRFKTALTVDVKPDSIKKNAKAFYSKVSRAGIPPTLNPSGRF